MLVVMFTADIHSPILAYLAGLDINLDDPLQGEVPSPQQRAKMVAENPVAAAK